MKRFIFVIGFLMIISVKHSFAGGLVTGENIKFVPPDKILFEQNFSKCPVGEPPSSFDKFAGAGECVKYNKHMWLAPSTDGDYRIYKKINLGDDEFAIEFDYVGYQNKGVPDFIFRFMNGSGSNWYSSKPPYDVEVFDSYKNYVFRLERVGDIGKIKNAHRKPVHIAIQVRRKQLRVYANGKRLTVVPFIIKNGSQITGFELMFIRDTNKYGEFISNIKVGKYSKKEKKPSPEKVGIVVQKIKEGTKLTIPEKILFDFNKFILKNNAKNALHVVAAYLKQQPKKKILIVGYTDNVGSDAYNMRLSLQRAQSVADYLIYVEGINKNIVQIAGRGKNNPIASNSTEDGRAKNRRVEIIIK